MNTCCTCGMCQRSIGLMIERLFMRSPRWMGLYDVQARAGLDWVDHDLYLLVFGRMVALGLLIESSAPGDECLALGLLIESSAPGDECPVYFLARCMRKGAA